MSKPWRPSIRIASFALVALGVAALEASAQAWKQGRTPDGQPDLQGVWVNFDSTPFEAPGAQPSPAPRPPAADVGPAPEFAVHDSPTSKARRSMVVEPADGR